VSPLDLDLGVDLQITDDPTPSSAPTATSTGFLIHSVATSGAPTDATEIQNAGQARALYEGEAALLAHTDAYFGAGGGRLFVVPLEADVEDAVALITPQMGPGQVMAPEVVDAADQQVIRDSVWGTNRVYLADAPDGADEAAVEALAAQLLSSEGRNSAIWGDTLLIPGLASGVTREVRSSVVAGGLIARSDRVTGNPNLAAAGNHTPGAAGQPDYVLGIKAERPFDEIKRLAQAQVNSFRTVNQRVRNYGFWTLADLDLLPHWWDLSGSRTMMAIRAEEAAVAEEMMFGQVAADGLFFDKYQGALSGVLARYQRLGAIFGTAERPGYNVDVTATVNPLANVAMGKITAAIRAQTSPFAAELELTITRRAITDTIA
jgi:hypothetical protein